MVKKIHLGVIIALLLVPVVVEASCNFHDIAGFAWSSNIGWVSLNCANTGGSIDYGVDINFDSPVPASMTGYGWSPNVGWVNFQPAGPYPTAPNYTSLFTRNEGESPTSTVGKITGWAKIESLGANGWLKMGPIVINATDYGVQVGTNRAFTGWSWNGGDDIGFGPEPDRGTGWVSWTGNDYGGAAVARWFETLYGDIYSGGDIDAPFSPPAGRYSATYLLQANGTIDPATITSSGGSDAPFRAENFGVVALPQQSNNYRGTMGVLDRTGILNGYYGAVTTHSGDSTTSGTLGANIILDGQIHHFTGNLTIDSELTFSKGSGTQKGSGTIIVDGNLIVNANTLYQSGAVASRNDNLPSAGWLIKGNITINQAVTALSGVFYSEGAGGITTGTTGSSLTDVPLVARGMFIAHSILLQRLYVAADNTPAEQIIFDGRAAINPPPGLGDMIKGLPALREVVPQS